MNIIKNYEFRYFYVTNHNIIPQQATKSYTVVCGSKVCMCTVEPHVHPQIYVYKSNWQNPESGVLVKQNIKLEWPNRVWTDNAC